MQHDNLLARIYHLFAVFCVIDPGMLSSLDDFYLMEETSISVVQTTNGIYNTSLYDEVLPQALPAWMRVRAANALAANGQQWAKALARHNGGTYNNQYMVIDAKRFAPGQVSHYPFFIIPFVIHF